MSDPDLGDHTAWYAKYPTPATQEQLEKLTELYGLKVLYEPTLTPGDSADYFELRTHDDKLVCRYFARSPIERFIANLAKWRRTAGS